MGNPFHSVFVPRIFLNPSYLVISSFFEEVLEESDDIFYGPGASMLDR